MDMIDQVIAFGLSVASSIPAVGPYLALALKVLGVLAVVLTSASTVLMALSGSLKIAGLSAAASWVDKVLPYVKFASTYNVQKPQA